MSNTLYPHEMLVIMFRDKSSFQYAINEIIAGIALICIEIAMITFFNLVMNERGVTTFVGIEMVSWLLNANFLLAIALVTVGVITVCQNIWVEFK